MTEKGYDQSLKHLNKYSNKISKPMKKKCSFDQQLNYQQKQQRTHVYNINKSDFRGLVQHLTGPSPPPPPIHNHKPQSSRLYSIRPPPITTNTPVLSSATTVTTVKDEENPQQAFPESPISAYMRYLRGSTPTTTSDFESSKGQFDFLNASLFSSPLFSPTTAAAQLEFPQVPPPPTTLAPSWKNV